MQITTEKLADNQILLNVQVEEEVVEKSLDQAYRRFVQKANIPGFRRGKAPRSMVERIVGRKVLMEDALERLVPELYKKAIEEQGIQPLGDPKIELVQVDPVVFKAVVPLPPVVELPDYRQFKVTPKEVVVSDEDLENFQENLRKDMAPWEPSQGPARTGNLLTLDLWAEEDGNKVLEQEGLSYVISDEATKPAPGMAEHLLGLERGDSKDFRISYASDYGDEAWAGRRLDFHVQVKEIKEKHLPALDDEFAKGVGDGFENLEALRQFVRGRLEEQGRRQARQQLEAEVVQAIVAGATLEFPPQLAEEEVDVLLKDLAGQFESRGITLAQYLKMSNKTEEELRDELLPQAKERVKRRLVLDKVAEEEGIEAEPGEVDWMAARAMESNSSDEKLKAAAESPRLRASFASVVRTGKTLDRLVELATAEDTLVEPEAEAAATPQAVAPTPPEAEAPAAPEGAAPASPEAASPDKEAAAQSEGE